MSQPADHVMYPVRMETRQWTHIDATMDNEVSVAAEDIDSDDVVELGSSIREAGWEQIPDWPSDQETLANWPPPGEIRVMILNRAQWSLVLSSLERWAGVADGAADPAGRQDARELRAVAELVRTELGQQGCGL